MNGVKLGTSKYYDKIFGKWMVYTEEECKQLRGNYVYKNGECRNPNIDGVYEGSYSIFCSDDPNVLNLAKKS